MVHRFLRTLTAAILISGLVSSAAFAQNPPPAGGAVGEEKSKPSVGGPRKQLATILFGGLGGAILGLSTLSFYGRPQEKLSNIAIGAGVGIIVATVYVTYRAATNPQELYGVSPERPQFERELELASNRMSAENETSGALPLVFNYSWDF